MQKSKFRDIGTLNIILLLCLYIDTPFSMKYSQVYFKYSYQPENVKNKNFVHRHFKYNTIAVFIYRYSFQHEIFSSLFEIQLSARKCKKSKFRDVGTLIIILLLCLYRDSFLHEIFSSLFEIQLSTRKCKKTKFRDVGNLIIILLLCS